MGFKGKKGEEILAEVELGTETIKALYALTGALNHLAHSISNKKFDFRSSSDSQFNIPKDIHEKNSYELSEGEDEIPPMDFGDVVIENFGVNNDD